MKMSVAIVCLAGLAVPALAQRAAEPLNTLRVPGYSASHADNNLIENFEAFPTGNLPINGWDSNFDDNFFIVDTGTISGTRSWRHVADNSGFADTGTSPTFTEAFGVVAADVRITGASLYQFNASSTTTATFNTRLNLNPNGTIEALQVVGGAGQFFPTTGTFTPGETFQLAIETLPSGGLNIYKNGVNIFSGDEINFALTGVARGSGQAFQFAGNTVGGNGEMTLDNFTNVIVPAPGVLALAGIGAAVGLRRRRA